MLTLYKRQIAEVWEIGRETPQPEWVRDAFRKNYICWLDEHVRILMTGLNPSLTTNLKIGTTGTVGGGFAGYGMYVLGYPGDFLDVTNHRVISAKKFHKEYQIIDGQKKQTMNFYDWFNFEGLQQKGALWKIVGSIFFVGFHLFIIYLVQR